MSQARGNGQNGGHFYSNITQPVKVELQFVVNSTDTGGLGVTSIKSNGYVRNVFMHTTATPGVGEGVTNPNPASGYCLVQLKGNYNTFLGMYSNVSAPTTGGTVTSLTAGTVYVINSLGTTTLAQWNTAGLPAGLTPTVGQSFVSLVTASIGGTGNVKVPGVSGILNMEMVGLPNTEISNSNIAANGGAWFLFQFVGASSSSVTTPIAKAPTDATIVNLELTLDVSSVTIDGL